MYYEHTVNNILTQYRCNSNKLKKRFLRKPNVPESYDNFSKLSQKCEHVGLTSYAALCRLAAARCESTLGNVTEEIFSLEKAGRLFFKSERDYFNLGCISPTNENIEAGLDCFTRTLNKYQDSCSLSINLIFEIIEYLKEFKKDEYIEDFLVYGLDLINKYSFNEYKIMLYNEIIFYFLKFEELTAALLISVKLYQLILSDVECNGYNIEILMKCEMNLVFLLMILQPHPRTLSPDIVQLLEKYTWDDVNDTLKDNILSENLFLLLKSLVTSCQSNELDNLIHLENKFWPFVDYVGKELLRLLIRSYCT